MNQINLSDYQNKYKGLDDSDIDLLENFFNHKKVKQLFKKIKKGDYQKKETKMQHKLKKSVNMNIIAIIIFFVMIIAFIIVGFYKFVPNFRYNFIIPLVICGVIWSKMFQYIKKLWDHKRQLEFSLDKKIKNKLIWQLVKMIDDSIEYDSTGKKSDIDVIELEKFIVNEVDLEKSSRAKYAASNFFNRRSNLPLYEDSIKWRLNNDTVDVKLNWIEIRSINSDNNIKDSYYLTTIEFIENRFNFDYPLFLVWDMADSIFRKVLLAVWVIGFLGIFIFLGVDKFWVWGLLHPYSLIAYFLVLLVVYGVSTKINSKIDLEDQSFEDIFDVYGDDQIEARQILRQSFMKEIAEYCKKIGEKTNWEFCFYENKIYIKRPLKKYKPFLNISKDLENNIEDFIRLYLHIKQTRSMIDELGLYYYDKKAFSNKLE